MPHIRWVDFAENDVSMVCPHSLDNRHATVLLCIPVLYRSCEQPQWWLPYWLSTIVAAMANWIPCCSASLVPSLSLLLFSLVNLSVSDIHSFPNVCGEASWHSCAPDVSLSLFFFKSPFPSYRRILMSLLRFFKPSSTSAHMNTQKMLCLECEMSPTGTVFEHCTSSW